MPPPSVERLGEYQLVRHLASGGMARVFLARVDGVGGFQRHVVLKCLRPERSEDAGYLTMFLDEARLVATLHHQHVAQVYEIGVADDGTHYLAMEYLHGETVRAVLERAREKRVRLPLDFCLTVIAAAAAGLHHAHERRGPNGQPLGIVHRDVSPSNVIVGYDGAVKLIDFGIAKAEERSTRTQTGFIKGKAGYMAPEQALGYAVDCRSDVFSLGVVMYELTTQVRAFRAPSEYEAVQRIVKGDLTLPTKLSSSYPQELESVVMSALQVDPDERFQDADAFRRAIEMTAHHLGFPIGGSCVTRVLADLFGSPREPWLDAAEQLADAQAPRMLAPSRTPRGTGPIGVPRNTDTLPTEDDHPTVKFVTLEDVTQSPAIVVGPPPPRMATGSAPPPFVAPPRPVPPEIVVPRIAEVSAPIHISRPRPRWPLIAGAFVLGLGTIALIWLVKPTAEEAAAPAAAVIETPAPTVTEAPAPVIAKPAAPAPLSKTIAVHITSDPAGAAVMLNNKKIGSTPYTGTLPRGSRVIELKLRKHDRATEKLEVATDHDVTWDVPLRKK